MKYNPSFNRVKLKLTTMPFAGIFSTTTGPYWKSRLNCHIVELEVSSPLIHYCKTTTKTLNTNAFTLKNVKVNSLVNWLKIPKKSSDRLRWNQKKKEKKRRYLLTFGSHSSKRSIHQSKRRWMQNDSIVVGYILTQSGRFYKRLSQVSQSCLCWNRFGNLLHYIHWPL